MKSRWKMHVLRCGIFLSEYFSTFVEWIVIISQIRANIIGRGKVSYAIEGQCWT